MITNFNNLEEAQLTSTIEMAELAYKFPKFENTKQLHVQEWND